LAAQHFWLSKPFPGGGRLLINQSYPYGNDLDGRLLLHNGVDAVEPGGTPLLAVADGTIIVAQDDWAELFGWRCNWYGHLVVLALDQTWLGQPIFVLYGHVLEIKVEEGQRVTRGEQLAEVGSGGAASVPHLHIEVRVGSNEFGATRNPMLWLDPASRGVIAGRLIDPTGRPWQGVGLSLIGHSEEASSGNTWSYLSDPLNTATVHPDESLAENFLFADVKPGEYEVYTKVQGVEYRAAVMVIPGEVSTVEIVTDASSTPTPTP
jgi:murein DD-endopeptidase MepM/ murein hydrolase activator NlpD